MSNKVKIGVIGAGGIANSVHLPSLVEIEDCDLVAVCDLREERAREAAEKYNIPHVYSSQYEMMKKEQLDGVLVLVDCDRTFRAAWECLENGWHVLLESPRASPPIRRNRWRGWRPNAAKSAPWP